jgi:outer membrane protein assembly factor BamB
VVAGAVWDVDLNGRLFALDAATGAVRFQTSLGGKPAHFAALAYGGGQIYTTTASGVSAFQLVGPN